MQHYMADLGDFIDMGTMQFVNPYEINPIVIDDIQPSEAAAITQQVSPDQNSLVLQKRDISQTALKMEEFSDLSGLLLGTNVDIIDSVDELNTPVIDKEEFGFPIQQPSSIQVNENKSDLKVKVEYSAQYYSCDKHIYTGLDLAPDNQVQIRGNYNSISKVGSEQNDVYLYPPNVHSISFKEKTNDAYDVYNPSNQGVNILDKMAAFNGTFNNLVVNNNIKNSNSTTTSPQEDRYSYISSPAEDQNMEDSVPNYYDHLYDAKPRLSLITEQIKFPVKQEALGSLNTPDVIDDVVSMGNDFNILDLVNNEDITIINADEDLFKSLTSPSVLSSEPSTPSTTVSKQTPTKKSRRRKLSDDDDDEDYVPPSKKKSTIRLSDIDVEHDNSSSDDSDYQTKKSTRKQNSKPRGRPSKRTDSVSSNGSKDFDVSKYRELRDKNNEASRKSRLKRKLKEQEYEKEANELHMKNIRLKAQVEELEKMVSTFRNNLFKILVNK